MRHIETWKAKVRAARAARPEPQPERQGGFWDAQRAAWFNRFAGKSDRSHTYCFVAPYVHGQVLEVGPGPGAYTRLMVSAAERIFAVEPSPYMAERLRQNVADATTVEIIEMTIENYLPHLAHYDLALAANVLSGIERIDEVLVGLASHADWTAIVMWSNARTPEWSKAVQTQLLGREQVGPDMPDHADLLAVLDELGLMYEVHNAEVPVHTFATPHNVVDWVQGFHGLGTERRVELETVLAAHISEADGKYGLLSGRDTQVILVRGTGS
jgi:SAM-dependent methyltransferase